MAGIQATRTHFQPSWRGTPHWLVACNQSQGASPDRKMTNQKITMSRVESVDAIRVIAIVAVIGIHTTPFDSSPQTFGQVPNVATVFNQLARFAVPVFFVLSGFFWGCKALNNRSALRSSVMTAGRLLLLAAAWSLLYLLLMNVYDQPMEGLHDYARLLKTNVLEISNRPLMTLMQGTKVHLWFLISLACSMLITSVLVEWKQQRLLVFGAVILFLIGTAGKAYSLTPIGFKSSFNLRDGPFFSLIFFVTGYLLSRYQNRQGWLAKGFFVALFGLSIHLAELHFLNRIWGVRLIQDYVFGTYFFGTGAAMVALSGSPILAHLKIAPLGPFVLGIYLSHFIFVDLLKSLDRQYAGLVAWDILYLSTVFLFSFLLTVALSKNRISARLVS